MYFLLYLPKINIKTQTMKKVKQIGIIMLMSISTVMLNGCAKKKGCMDKDSKVYDKTAEQDDGSCTYEGSYVFWKSQPMPAGASIDIYLNGVFQGNIGVHFNSAPTCGAQGALTVVKNLGSNKTQAFSITGDSHNPDGTTDYDVPIGTANFNANTCTSLKLD